MKQEDYTYIEELIQRFFAGETTNAEEKELYAFFSGNEFPEELEKYRSVFAFFEVDYVSSLRGGTTKQSISDSMDCFEQALAMTRRNRLCKILGIAAAFLALVIIPGSIYFHKMKNYEVREENFVMINGEKITDPQRIESEINTALLEYMFEEMEINSLLKNDNSGYKNEQWDYIEVTIRE